MKDELIINMPFQVKILGIRLTINRKVGFLFTNLSMYLLRESANIQTSTDYNKWIKDLGEVRVLSNLLYYSAVAWCMQNRKKQKFTKSSLLTGINLCDEETQTRLFTGWQKSQTFGVKVDEKKNPKRK
jgi:hypothetical protein